MKRVVIIGAGITGLSAAHRLLESQRELAGPLDIVVLEASDRPGGVVQTHERDGFLLEHGPDSFISEKPEALELARRIGLESHIITTNEEHRHSFVVRDGNLLPVPPGFYLLAPAQFWPFVTSPIFSWRGKARMAMDLLLPRRTNGDEDESLAHFVRRRLGREALERMAQPMLGGIYTADPETLSLRATMPRFLEMEREHRSLIRALRKDNRPIGNIEKAPSSRRTPKTDTSGARYSLFLSFDRGMQLLTDTLAERIVNWNSETCDSSSSPQAAIRLNTKVAALTLERDAARGDNAPKWKVKTDHEETLAADAVCLALPTYVSAGLLRVLDAQLASELDAISYASSATINLAYKREDIPHPLNGFGFVVPFIEKRSLIACTFSNVKFAGRAPQGHVLLRAFMGGALQPEIIGLDEVDLIARVRRDFRDLLGIERPPLFVEISKWEDSMPQYEVGNDARVKRIANHAARFPGLTLAGNAYAGVGIPDCIRSGETAAQLLIHGLSANTGRQNVD